jgi:hypothetical protein
MTATGWLKHSVRGFISIAGKKQGVKIESSKNEAGDRLYKIVKWKLPTCLHQAASKGAAFLLHDRRTLPTRPSRLCEMI